MHPEEATGGRFCRCYEILTKFIAVLDFLTIDQDMLDHACHIKRTAVDDDNVGIFSLFQGTDTVSDADVFCRVDGYGAERVILVHSGFDGETCAERQVLHLIP